MKDDKFLLTYIDCINKEVTFSWFNSQKDMDDFIENNKNIHVMEGIKVIKCEYIYGDEY